MKDILVMVVGGIVVGVALIVIALYQLGVI